MHYLTYGKINLLPLFLITVVFLCHFLSIKLGKINHFCGKFAIYSPYKCIYLFDFTSDIRSFNTTKKWHT
jgi:hypothetical protein